MLPRLLECGLMPWFWLDYSPEAPAEIFGGRTEGYFAPMIFTGDTHRLEMDGASVIVTMSYTYDEKLVTMNPGMRMPLSELRFRREDLEKLAGECKTDSTAETMKLGAGGTAEQWTEENESQLLKDLETMSQQQAANKWGVSKTRIQTVKKRAESKTNNQQGGMWNGLMTNKRTTSSK